MKKNLLFVLAFCLALGGFAQKKTLVSPVEKTKDIIETAFQSKQMPSINFDKAVDEDINRFPIATTSNVRAVRREDSKVLSYNSELGMISVTFLLDPGTYGTNSRDIGMIYSTDMGETWSDVVVIVDNGGEYENDYASGIVYNPAGNSNVDEAYGVVQNIANQNNWATQYKMWSSITLAGENQSIEIVNEDNEEANYWNQFGLVQTNELVHCLGMWPEGGWGEYTSAALQPITGEFEGDGFYWDQSELLDMSIFKYTGASETGTIDWIGRFQGTDGGIDMAWSDDGQTGYIWMIGSTEDAPSGWQPIVYKSEDAGDSWDFIDLDLFEDEVQVMFEDYMPATWAGNIIPRIQESAGIVDYHGDLQLSFIADAYSTDVIVNPDSLGGELFIYMSPGDVYNMELNSDGVHDVIYIDSLYSDVVTDGNDATINFAGTVGWTHRLSMAKNDFENEIFVTWTDSRIVEAEAKNVEPDIFGWSRNIYNGNVSEPVCFTEGTLYEKFYFFTYGAGRAVYDNGVYTIPYLQTITPGEFSSNSATDPLTINYVTGIEFTALGEYVGLEDINNISSFEITQNKPNPFTGSTVIEIKTETTSSASIEVTSLLGQTVYSMNADIINGSQKVEINAENLKSGVYFYTVTIGNESLTKKMIVE